MIQGINKDATFTAATSTAEAGELPFLDKRMDTHKVSSSQPIGDDIAGP